MEKVPVTQLIWELLTNSHVKEPMGYSGGPRARQHGPSEENTTSRTCEPQSELLMTAPRHTIAIVEDDPSLLKALGRLLAEHGYGVELFSSFADVLKSMPASNATCFLIDCQLGQFSGIELARELTASGNVCPVIFMTASDDESVRQQAVALGCAAFLRKPFLQTQLLEAVGKVSPNESAKPVARCAPPNFNA